MQLLRTRLSIDDFILRMLDIPSAQLGLEQLQDWVSRLVLNETLFRHHIAFSDRTYQRKLLCRTSRFDMLVLCWRPGQASTIHDHADSLNVTRVYQGVLTARTFDNSSSSSDRCCSLQTSTSSLSLADEGQLERHHLTTVERHQIHQLANQSDANVVTLHVYARPLHSIRVYCPQSGHAERVPVQYEIADECA